MSPCSPTVSVDAVDLGHDDGQTLLIPITPVEDEDMAVDSPSVSATPFSLPASQQPLILAPGIPSASQCSLPIITNPPNQKPATGMAVVAEPDVVAAASAAFNAIMKSNEHGNLIDQDLLIKLLNNPKMIEKLVTDYGTATNSTKPRSPPMASLDQPPVHIDRAVTSTPSSVTVSSIPFYHQPNGAGVGPPNPRLPSPAAIPVSSSLSIGAPAKDINYYKSLIQQHGGERQETLPQYGNRNSHQPSANQELVNNQKPRDLRPKIMKPCIYFNSSRGCRHGANCSYQHDASFQQRGSSSVQEVQSAKRMKLDREISS